ncbi:MAG: DUF1622 domain-containing protein [Acidobacteriota bacterium]
MANVIFGGLLLLQESVRGVFSGPGETVVEPTIVNLVSWLKLSIELTGAVIISIGVVLAFVQFVKVLIASRPEHYTKIRLLLARYLALALEFQLGADILSTAISPSWDQIGKLGAIAVIRTALNYFLSREMQEERRVTESGTAPANEKSGDPA